VQDPGAAVREMYARASVLLGLSAGVPNTAKSSVELASRQTCRDENMKALGGLALVATAVVVSTSAATAQERVTDAAVGAVAGAVVAGPVGFVGGGLIGYVAGPQIGCDLGVERCHRRSHYRHSGYSPANAPGPPSSPGTTPVVLAISGRANHGNY
jgi:hypothetical protein